MIPLAETQPLASLVSPRGRHISRSATLIALTLASAAETWTASGVSLTLTDLTGTLSASSDEASWALTVYMSAFAISIALSHRLSLRFGNRGYLALCALVYAVSAAGCALSPNLGAFLFFRATSGFAGGVFLVRAFVFFTHQFEAAYRIKPLVGYAIVYFFVGRLMSPIVSGWLADVSSWRLLFIFPAMLMLIASALFWRYSADHWTAEDEQSPLDFVGILLLVFGAAFVQTVLSRGEIDGWFESPLLCMFALAGFGGNVLFVLWQLSSRNRYPLLDLAFIRHPSARAGAILGFLIGILLAGSLYVIPQYLRSLESHSALQTGLLLSIGGAASVLILFCFPLIIRLFATIGGRSVILFSLLVEMASQVLFARYLTPDTPDTYLWLPLALNGVFIALSVPTLGIVAFIGVDKTQASNARAMYYGCRQLGAAVGVTFAAALIDRRMSFHSSRLLDAFANRDLSILGGAANLPDRMLAVMIRRQGAVLSYADVFFAMTLVAMTTLVFIPLIPSLSSPGSSPSENHSDAPHLAGTTETT
jgi:EmrB/QacA subfamily drug resistance transporter